MIQRDRSQTAPPGPRSSDAVDFAALFAALPTPYVVLDCELVIVEANEAYLAATAHARDALLGRRLFEAFPPRPELLDESGMSPPEAFLRRVRESGTTESMPVFRHDVADAVTGELEERHWLLVVAPVLGADGRTALLVQRTEDLTDVVRVREQGALAEALGERSRERVAQVESDLLAQAQQLAIAVAEGQAASAQSSALADVALALVSAESLEAVERAVFERGFNALGAQGGALLTATEDEQWRLCVNALGGDVQDRYGVLPYDSPLPACWTARTTERLLLPTRTSGLAFLPQMEQVYADTARLGWAFLPLSAAGTALGSLAVAWVQEHEPDAAELEVLEAFAAQCAQALLRLRSTLVEQSAVLQVRTLAEQLQDALLTPAPEPAGLEVVVRYQAAADADVGGDWYDAFVQPGGATMLVIGDVIGHDSAAAAAMGQLRGLLRALAYDPEDGRQDSPAVVLHRLERVAAGLDVMTLATAVLARIDTAPRAAADRLRWSNAGHPPPVLLAPDGTSTVLATAPDLLLGIDAETARHVHSADLPHGSTLLLFTDGLIERRHSTLDEGVARLQAALADLGRVPLGELCDRLLARLAGGEVEDDIALVAVRSTR